MKRFEYHIFKVEAAGWFAGGKVDTGIMAEHINTLGAEGWELATAFDTSKYQGETRDVILIFKRERQD